MFRLEKRRKQHFCGNRCAVNAHTGYDAGGNILATRVNLENVGNN